MYILGKNNDKYRVAETNESTVVDLEKEPKKKTVPALFWHLYRDHCDG